MTDKEIMDEDCGPDGKEGNSEQSGGAKVRSRYLQRRRSHCRRHGDTLTTKSPGIVLVHGYSGSPHDFDFLSSILVESYGKDAVETVSLPGHNNGDLPPFDAEAFVRTITGHVDYYIQQGRPIVLVGHSTGGSLLLNYLGESGFVPQLLILAGTPKKIDGTWLERWSGHREEKEIIPFNSVAKMVSLVNTAGKGRFEAPFPVHVIQGGKDTLVPVEEARLWEKDTFAGPVSVTIISNGDHRHLSGNCERRNDAVRPQGH